ncbi:hypothetical protein FLAPJACK_214 [Bacillus phage Flapjack]|uniref:HNH endonuclease n=1 Tax=Bacillus phage Flapjack TaxID=1983465 RepID=A0A1X9SGG1_9CAUD|nr:hypothetical protein FLAPJACK_214 [Bacillus phage Flapjack]
MEKWVSLKGVIKEEGDYSVSDKGRIRNNQTGIIRKLTNHKSGYHTITIQRSTYYIHRLVATCFIPNPAGLKVINHLDGNKRNNDKDNLVWTSASDNIIHAIETGLQVHRKGESHYSTSLTEGDVIDIKKRLINKEKGRDIAKDYNVTHTVISNIKTGRTWCHVKVDGFVPKYSKNPQRVSG